MRIILFITFLSLFGCKEAIKNEKTLAINAKPEDIAFVVPVVNNSLVVNASEDLLGYWVGDFEVDMTEEQHDSLYQSDYRELESLTKRITLSIDAINGSSIKGHSIVGGNISSFEGELLEGQLGFSIVLSENNNDKTDGDFQIAVQKNDSVLKGRWQVKKMDAVKFGKKKFELKKRLFKYDANLSLDSQFKNTDKSKHVIIRDTIDGEEEVYEDEEYLSTTEKIFEKNASAELLDKEFVSNLTKGDIYILRNSIFARHGFAFRDKQLRMYFENYEWYMPIFGDVKDDLTSIEKKNVELLLRYEQNATEYYDVFGR
nr:YARHG domain-containing protein [uncultured Flavobacterium sp.]